MILPKKGDIIELLEMVNDPQPLDVGDKGEVTGVVPWSNGEVQIQVRWESGRGLHLIYPIDKFKIIKKAP